MGLTLNGSINQLVVAAKDHVLGPHLDSLRRVWRSTVMSEWERMGGIVACMLFCHP